MSSFIKDRNRNVKHLLLRKTDVLKTSILSERKFVLALKSKKVQVIFTETFILAQWSSAVFRLQNRVSGFF